MKNIISFLAIIGAISFIISGTTSDDSKITKRLQYLLKNSYEDDYKVYVFFNDKGPDISKYLANPLSIVSEKSLERRKKVKPINSLVDFTDIPIYDGYVRSLLDNVKKIRFELKWLNCVSVEASKNEIYKISQKDFVKKIDIVERVSRNKNFDEKVSESNIPEIKDFPLVDSLNYGNGFTQISQIKVNVVHNQGIYGQGVMIASFDAGYQNPRHEVFTTLPMDIFKKRDFKLNLMDSVAYHSHGQGTLSLVGGYKPGQMIGPAFKSTYVLCRTEVDPTETPSEMDYWIAAAQWVDSLGADVITSSLGYLEFDAPYQSYTWQDMNGNTMPITIAADLAVNKGIVVSNSAGNNGSNTSHNTLNGPADGDSVITVGAVTSTGSYASFSSVGPTTDNPPRIKPDVMALGSGNYVASGAAGNSYSSFGSGTSYSCPLTSGVIGLMLSANKNLTPMQIRSILINYASNKTSPNNTLGWGIIDAEKSVDTARKLDIVTPTIIHNQPFVSTPNTGTIILKAKIFDNGIIRYTRENEAPRIYYRKNTGSGWSNFISSVFSSVSRDTFTFQIPGSTTGTQVEYYFAAQDIALPASLVSTLPTGGSGINPPGTIPPGNRFLFVVGTTPVNGGNNTYPNVFKLHDNFPNPFNPVTNINFDIPKETNVKLIIYDISGKFVEELVNKKLLPGYYSVNFKASNLASGLYFCVLKTDSFSDKKKMILLK